MKIIERSEGSEKDREEKMFPVRCYTCGKVISGTEERYERYLQSGMSIGQALDKLGFERYCCRQIVMTSANLLDKMLELEDHTKNRDRRDRRDEIESKSN